IRGGPPPRWPHPVFVSLREISRKEGGVATKRNDKRILQTFGKTALTVYGGVSRVTSNLWKAIVKSGTSATSRPTSNSQAQASAAGQLPPARKYAIVAARAIIASSIPRARNFPQKSNI